jgi:hypothetical protein
VRREHPPGLSCKFLRREDLQILSGGAGASYREILAKPANGTQPMVLVTTLGGSGAVSGPMVDHVDGYPLRHAN